MGFDPMTHRRRTDIFASLPHLLALANLKEIIDHRSLEEHAVRLQAEAVQMAKLQYLQHLLNPNQPSLIGPSNSIPTTSDNTINSNIITDVESFNLLNSLATIKDNIIPVGLDDSVPFSHLPYLQFSPCVYDQTPLDNKNSRIDGGDHHLQFKGFNEGQNSPNTPWLLSNSTPASPPPSALVQPPPAVVTQTPTDWQQLLFEDPLFNDIPLN